MPKVHKDIRVIRDTKGQQELMLVKVPKVMMVHKGHRVIREIKEHQELMLVKVLKVLMVLKVHKDNRELMLVKVLKVLLEHKVLKDIRVTKVDYLPSQFLQVVLSYGLEQQMLFQVVGYCVMALTTHQT